MTHNETRISNERLVELVQRAYEQKTKDLWRALRELQVLRSTSVEAAKAFDDAVTAELLVEHSGCGHGVQVEQVTARLAPGDAVYVVRGKFGQVLLVPKSDRIVTLYAHPLPNPSPSDGEVSEAMVDFEVFNRWLRTWVKQRFGKWITHNTAKGAHSSLTAALQSKRGKS